VSGLLKISGCDNAERKADVIFVHGLGGDALATWRHGEDDSTSWPHWLGEEFPEVGVWSLDYAASPTKLTRFLGWFSQGKRNAGYSMALPDRALQMLDVMSQAGLGQRPLMFVCHSLGGLLAKQILRTADDATVDSRMRQVAANTRAVLFLATPHCGAELASLLDAFRSVFGTTVSIEDLRAHDAHLLNLYNWYRRHAEPLGIQTETYYEKRGVGGALMIVNPTSAQCGAGSDAIPLDEDHLSIAKPRERGAQVCNAARGLLSNYVLTPRPAKPTEQFASSEPPRTPCEVPPAAERHFGRRAELEWLTKRLGAGRNAAVIGPAGMGKTALAAEAVRAVVTPATLATSPFPDGVVFLDLYTFRGQAEPAWNNLANALAGPGFLAASPARGRATEACRARRILLIVEGGEEADGIDDRASIETLFSVLSPQNRRLLLTRLSTQAVPAESVELKEALHHGDAAKLLDSLTQGRVTGAVREQVLALAEGHPLALTWAGNLLARGDEDPGGLAAAWQSGGLPKLSDPTRAGHTLQWLFSRSVRGLDGTTQRLLEAAGLLARAPFPLAAMQAALGDPNPTVEMARQALRSLVQRGLLRRVEGEADHWQFTHVLGYRFARKETGSDPLLRESLARWLSGHLEAALRRGLAEGVVSLSRPLEHCAALLRADEDQRLWIPLANSVLYDTRERLVALGRLDLVVLALDAVRDWLGGFPVLKAQQPEWLRERSVLLNFQGDVLGAQGDLSRALAAYRESLAVDQRLAGADPSNANRQRDLSVSHNKMGDVLSEQGDLSGALAAYRESLAMRQRLAAAAPSNADRQRDLSVSHDKVGEVLSEQGDLSGALAAHSASLAVIQRLAASDPSNDRWQRALGASQDRMGNVLSAQGDLSGALAVYREALALRQRLAATDPSNAVWQRDVSVSQERMGDVLREQGDLSGALAAHRESLAVRQRLAAADPSNAGWQRDLSYSLMQLASVHERQGNRTEALPLAEESLAIDERLAALDRTNVTWQDDVAFSRALVARLRR